MNQLKKGIWATPLEKVRNLDMPSDAININVEGREPTAPHQGFGRMWLRTYRISIPSDKINPAGLMTFWKEKFSALWPPGNSFFTSPSGIQPGEVGLINLSMPGGLKLATGAVIMYVDENSFSLMTVQGHMFSGWITFSCYSDGGNTYAQTQALIRPNDLLYELSFIFGFGPKSEDVFWHQILKNIASNYQVRSEVEQTVQLIDSRIQWNNFSNLWYNAGVRSGIYLITSPFRKLFQKK